MRRALGLSLATIALLAATALATEYRVRAGDTLSEVAERHDTTVEALKRANDLDSDVIHPGQVLRIPSSGGGSGITDVIDPDGGGAAEANRRRTVTADVLNVRERPSTDSPTIGRLERGDRVEVVEERGAWRRLASGGWVHGDHLTDAGAVSEAGFVQLPDEGPGFYSYYPAHKRWGTPTLVEGLKRVCRRFNQRHPDGPRIGFGDISLRNGGDIDGHASHERGVDVDISPLRDDGREARREGLGKLKWQHAAYSRRLTQELIDLIREELPVVHIFFNDPEARGTSPWPNHDDHLHVRIRR